MYVKLRAELNEEEREVVFKYIAMTRADNRLFDKWYYSKGTDEERQKLDDRRSKFYSDNLYKNVELRRKVNLILKEKGFDFNDVDIAVAERQYTNAISNLYRAEGKLAKAIRKMERKELGTPQIHKEGAAILYDGETADVPKPSTKPETKPSPKPSPKPKDWKDLTARVEATGKIAMRGKSFTPDSRDFQVWWDENCEKVVPWTGVSENFGDLIESEQLSPEEAVLCPIQDAINEVVLDALESDEASELTFDTSSLKAELLEKLSRIMPGTKTAEIKEVLRTLEGTITFKILSKEEAIRKLNEERVREETTPKTKPKRFKKLNQPLRRKRADEETDEETDADNELVDEAEP